MAHGIMAAKVQFDPVILRAISDKEALKDYIVRDVTHSARAAVDLIDEDGEDLMAYEVLVLFNPRSNSESPLSAKGGS